MALRASGKGLTKKGASPVARVDAHTRDHDHARQAEIAGLALAQAAIDGLQDLAAGRVLDEVRLDRALVVKTGRPRKKA